MSTNKQNYYCAVTSFVHWFAHRQYTSAWNCLRAAHWYRAQWGAASASKQRDLCALADDLGRLGDFIIQNAPLQYIRAAANANANARDATPSFTLSTAVASICYHALGLHRGSKSRKNARTHMARTNAVQPRERAYTSVQYAAGF